MDRIPYTARNHRLNNRERTRRWVAIDPAGNAVGVAKLKDGWRWATTSTTAATSAALTPTTAIDRGEGT